MLSFTDVSKALGARSSDMADLATGTGLIPALPLMAFLFMAKMI